MTEENVYLWAERGYAAGIDGYPSIGHYCLTFNLTPTPTELEQLRVGWDSAPLIAQYEKEGMPHEVALHQAFYMVNNYHKRLKKEDAKKLISELLVELAKARAYVVTVEQRLSEARQRAHLVGYREDGG